MQIATRTCNVYSSFSLQAYAELEKDTPGQIFGVTHKTDGKSSTSDTSNASSSSSRSSSSFSSSSSSPPIDERFTQKANDERNYEDTDATGTHEYRERNADKRFFYIGAVAVILFGFYWFIQSQSVAIVDYERDWTLREQAERRAEKERQEQQHELNVGSFAPDNQPRSV